MKITNILTICLALLSLPTHAAKWIDIAGNDEVTVFVDADSIRKNGSRVKSWLLWKWRNPQNESEIEPYRTYLTEKQLQVSDCKNRSFAIAQGIRYTNSQDGDVLNSYTIDEKAWKFSEAAPETIGESLVNYACKQRPIKR